MCCIAKGFSFPPFPNHNCDNTKCLNNKERLTEEETESPGLAFPRGIRVSQKSHNRWV